MSGLNETKDVVKFVLSLGESIAQAAGDGKISLDDVGFFMSSLHSFGPAINAVDQVPEELSELTAEEKDELIKFVKEEFDIPDDKAEEITQTALTIALELYYLFRLFTKKVPA